MSCYTDGVQETLARVTRESNIRRQEQRVKAAHDMLEYNKKQFCQLADQPKPDLERLKERARSVSEWETESATRERALARLRGC
jgi:hypothetical protein